MHQFFIEPSWRKQNKIYMDGSEVVHMKNVLRIKPGESVKISDGQGTEYLCEVERYEEQAVILDIVSEAVSDCELPSRIYLFQGLPKSDKMELIIQKAVELGAYEIVPVVTERTVVKLDEKKAEKKVQRWNAISLSAAKQSGRSLIPEVKKVLTFKEALDYAKKLNVLLIPYELAKGMEETKSILEAIAPGQSVGVFIGPEGGFREAEVELAVSYGAKPITLGKRILRTETAGLAALSVLMFQLEK